MWTIADYDSNDIERIKRIKRTKRTKGTKRIKLIELIELIKLIKLTKRIDNTAWYCKSSILSRYKILGTMFSHLISFLIEFAQIIDWQEFSEHMQISFGTHWNVASIVFVPDFDLMKWMISKYLKWNERFDDLNFSCATWSTYITN